MGTPPRLRNVRLDDAAQIARLADELGYPATTQNIAARLTLLLSQPHHHLVVAQGDDGLLGWIAVERRLTLEAGERIEIVGWRYVPSLGGAVSDKPRWPMPNGGRWGNGSTSSRCARM